MAANIIAEPKFKIDSPEDTLEVYKEDGMINIYSHARTELIELTKEEAEAVCSCILALVDDE